MMEGMDESEKKPLYGLTLSELETLCLELGQKKFAARQLAEWIYAKNTRDFSLMSNLSKEFRETLQLHYHLDTAMPGTVHTSVDGTKKYLFPAAGRWVEAAYIPEEKRATLCLSSQVGCKMGCVFCMTGKQGFQANLSAGEIVAQVANLPERETLTNIVYMGMGEPLDNLEPVLNSVEILTAPWGFGFSPNKITISSIGIIPALEEFLKKSKARFALSVHSPFDEERSQLMPVQRVYPLSEVLGSIRKLEDGQKRRLSAEYILFGGINDTPRHARELVKLFHGLTIRVNLIKFHTLPGTPLLTCPPERMEAFRDELTSRGIHATIRRSRGEDIYAACGLLSTRELVKKDRDQQDY